MFLVKVYFLGGYDNLPSITRSALPSRITILGLRLVVVVSKNIPLPELAVLEIANSEAVIASASICEVVIESVTIRLPSKSADASTNSLPLCLYPTWVSGFVDVLTTIIVSPAIGLRPSTVSPAIVAANGFAFGFVAPDVVSIRRNVCPCVAVPSAPAVVFAID